MTFCLGWIDGNQVYLVADSLATFDGPRPGTVTSFGQTGAEFTEECLIKLVPISDLCVIAYSGNLGTVRRALEFLKSALHTLDDLELALSSLSTSIGPLGIGDEAELLIALGGSDGPRLCKWNPAGTMHYSDGDLALTGSLEAPFHEVPVVAAIQSRTSGEAPPLKLLMVVSALLALAQVENLTRFGVGGAVYGLYVDSEGIHWQPDARYVAYGPKGKIHSACVLVRANVLVVNSDSTGGAHCFTSSISTPSWELWMEQWHQSAAASANSADFSFWIFLSAMWPFATIVYWHPDDGDGRYFRLSTLPNGSIDLVLTPEFFDNLNQEPPKEQLEGRPFVVRTLDGRS